MVEVVRCWAEKRGLTMLSGQNLDSTCTFPVPLLCWEEIFTQMASVALSDPEWRKRIEATLAHGRPRVAAQFGACAQAPELSNLLCAMFESVEISDDLLPWIPLLNVVLPELSVSGKVVAALLERDQQHTTRTRLAEVCLKMLEAFLLRHLGGVVVLMHMRFSTSFFQDNDVHNGNITRALAEFCMRRREMNKGPQILYVVVSRKKVLADEMVMRCAEHCRGFVYLDFLSVKDTKLYTKHYLSSKLARKPSDESEDCSPKRAITTQDCVVQHLALGGKLRLDASKANELPDSILSYVRDMTQDMGSPLAIELVCKQLLSTGMIAKVDRGEVVDREALDELPYPSDLKGLTLSMFESLEYHDKELLKVASVLAAPFKFDVLSKVSGVPIVTLEKQLLRLQDQGILIQVEPGMQSPAHDRSSSTSIEDAMSCFSGASRHRKARFAFRGIILRVTISGLMLQRKRDDILDQETSCTGKIRPRRNAEKRASRWSDTVS